MKRRQLNVFTHLIARYLKWGYSSAQRRRRRRAFKLCLIASRWKKGPADEGSPWTHYQKSD